MNVCRTNFFRAVCEVKMLSSPTKYLNPHCECLELRLIIVLYQLTFR